MSASGKKGKKSKGKVVSLSEFLSDDHGTRSGEAVVMAPSKTSWADEMEEESVYKEKLVLPTAPRAARGSDVDDAKIPNAPPYTAYIANLPYDIEVEDVNKFFHGLSVKSVRLPRDGGEGGRLRGFGYAEFESRQDLVDALMMNELLIKNRKIRVDIASCADGDQEQGPGMGGMGRGRGRPSRDEDREDRTPSDWRNAPREAAPASERPGFRGGDRGGDRDRDRDRGEMGSRYDAGFNPRERAPGAGGPPERSSFGPRRDGPSGGGFGRDGPSYERRDGPSSYDRDRRDGPSSYDRDRRDGPSSYDRDRRDGPSFDRPRRDGPPSYDRERRDGPSFDRERDRQPEAPKERPKLSLKPRSTPAEEGAPEKPVVSAPPPAEAPSAASIFGAAKPVDTAARERAIEERLREKEREKEREREQLQPRESAGSRPVDRQDDRDNRPRDGSGGRQMDRRGDHRSEDDQRHSRPAREGDYRPPQRSGGGDSYRPPPRDGDYRPPRPAGGDRDSRGPPPSSSGRHDNYSRPAAREGDYRPPRGDHRDGNQNGTSSSRGGSGPYRAPNGNDNRSRNSRDETQSANAQPTPEERIRRLEEPKAPVFEVQNKFSYLLADDEAAESSDGREDQ